MYFCELCTVKPEAKPSNWDLRRKATEHIVHFFPKLRRMRSGSTAMAWETAAKQSSTELRSKLDLHRRIFLCTLLNSRSERTVFSRPESKKGELFRAIMQAVNFNNVEHEQPRTD